MVQLEGFVMEDKPVETPEARRGTLALLAASCESWLGGTSSRDEESLSGFMILAEMAAGFLASVSRSTGPCNSSFGR